MHVMLYDFQSADVFGNDNSVLLDQWDRLFCVLFVFSQSVDDGSIVTGTYRNLYVLVNFVGDRGGDEKTYFFFAKKEGHKSGGDATTVYYMRVWDGYASIFISVIHNQR